MDLRAMLIGGAILAICIALLYLWIASSRKKSRQQENDELVQDN